MFARVSDAVALASSCELPQPVEQEQGANRHITQQSEVKRSQVRRQRSHCFGRGAGGAPRGCEHATSCRRRLRNLTASSAHASSLWRPGEIARSQYIKKEPLDLYAVAPYQALPVTGPVAVLPGPPKESKSTGLPVIEPDATQSPEVSTRGVIGQAAGAAERAGRVFRAAPPLGARRDAP